MTRTHFRLFPIAFMSAVILINAWGKKCAEWQGTIENVDGVTVVKNLIEPLNPDLEIYFQEDLTIGMGEGDEDYMFGGRIVFMEFPQFFGHPVKLDKLHDNTPEAFGNSMLNASVADCKKSRYIQKHSCKPCLWSGMFPTGPTLF